MNGLPATSHMDDVYLRRLIGAKLNDSDIAVVWFDVFEESMDDAIQRLTKPQRIIELICKCQREEAKPLLLKTLRINYPHLSNDLSQFALEPSEYVHHPIAQAAQAIPDTHRTSTPTGLPESLEVTSQNNTASFGPSQSGDNAKNQMNLPTEPGSASAEYVTHDAIKANATMGGGSPWSGDLKRLWDLFTLGRRRYVTFAVLVLFFGLKYIGDTKNTIRSIESPLSSNASSSPAPTAEPTHASDGDGSKTMPSSKPLPLKKSNSPTPTPQVSSTLDIDLANQ